MCEYLKKKTFTFANISNKHSVVFFTEEVHKIIKSIFQNAIRLSAAHQNLQILQRKKKYTVRVYDSVVICTSVCSTDYLQVCNSCQTSLGDTLELDSDFNWVNWIQLFINLFMAELLQ